MSIGFVFLGIFAEVSLADLLITAMLLGLWFTILRKCLLRNEIVVDYTVMTIKEQVVFFTRKQNEYNLSGISNIQVLYNEPSKTNYWSMGDDDNPPEEAKNYLVNPVMLSFCYENREVIIGDGLRAFDAEGLKEEITRRQKI
jgi:hypothetical protein